MKFQQDYQQFYQQITRPFLRYQWLATGLRILNKLIVWVMYIAYATLLLWKYFGGGLSGVLPVIIIPGMGFILLSLIRRKLNCPRPYEEWSIRPLIPRKGKGKSMPSRHVFSATVIALSVMSSSILYGTCLLVLAVLLAVTRVIGGAHYPRDVVAGFLCGLVCGIGVFLI
ncbi:MAG: phosphatase PAP2 family protein [Limosilactobacillus sp.]|jgi:membrane-associated phospholipid phosphatase|uniref:phosphatase PAP2 family protein n=1 Tax=Limosilactobacillus sp. TaxID=2773925 RepID=UPI0025C2F111|nr:phosphatase PAP2 family protein [Limosilactobacillus sp.]MCI1975476.1 phosphatase PAP2 family protein [Limosilactobacillus sp.]MCI2031358.1 phosphatase PAP2 family protein [Limosilactobacillus sp.]